jgi:plastocyanin
MTCLAALRPLLAAALSVGLLAPRAALHAAPRRTHRAAPATPTARDVDVVGLDYAFTLPASLPAGATRFRFRNAGKVAHEVNISLLRPGATVEQFIAARNAGRSLDLYREASVGVLFASPGHSSAGTLATNLLPGRTYVLICIDQDSPTAKPHYQMGMFAGVTVGPSKAAIPAPMRTDTIVGADYAFRYPRTLAPGHHRFAFVNAGTHKHEAFLLRLRDGVTVTRLIQTAQANGDFGSLVADGIGVLVALPGGSPVGYLDVELLPGKDYTLLCTEQDDPKSPPHLMLGMVGTIAVPLRTSGRP